MAHDLRNPMNTILTGAAVLESQAQPDSARISKMIMRAVRRMDDLVGDMLDLSRIERGLLVDMQMTPLLPLVEAALVSARENAGDKRIAATVEVSGEGKVDPLRIAAMLVRLVGLALGYSPPGAQIDFSARTFAGQFHLRVRDGGAGVAPENVNDLFLLHFGREHRGYRDRTAAISIAIIRGIVQAHKGTITAESAHGQGVTFTIAIPL